MLMLDPDSDLVEIIKRRLEESGWSVKRIKQLEAAKKELQKKRTDVFFFDPAFEVCPESVIAELISDPQYHHPKVLVYTQSGSRKDIEHMKQAGVHVYWLKGHISLSDLLRNIKKLI